MANAVTVKVDGVRELRSKLAGLRTGMDRRIVSDALRAGAEVIKADAGQRAPMAAAPHRLAGRKGKWVSPGFLRSQIRITTRRRNETDHFASVSINVRGAAFYWRFLEFGTRFIRPRPFLRPAFEMRKYEALARIMARLAERIERLAGTRLR